MKTVSRKPRGLELPASTQDHVHVRGVEPPGFLISDDGTIAGALIVEAVDLALAGEQGASVWHEMFARFIGGLRHTTPIQIVISTKPQRCDEYRQRVYERVQRLEALADEAQAAGDRAGEARRRRLAALADAHLGFFEALLDTVRPREEEYLLVTWHNPFPILHGSRVLSQEKLEAGKQEVERKLMALADALSHIGLSVRRATAEDLTRVVFGFYHMTISPLARLERPGVLIGTLGMGSYEETI